MLADPTRAAEVLRQAQADATRLGRPVLASTTRAAPAQDAITCFADAADAEDRVLWLRPATGEALVGIGAAHSLGGEGTDRFGQVSRAWRSLLADAIVDDPFAQPGTGPLLLGGFSFDPHRTPTAAWAGFGQARLVLPEHTLVVRAGAAWLTTNAVVGPTHTQPATPPPRDASPEAEPSAEQALSASAWQTLVGAVARGIRNGQLGIEKVVLARGVDVHAPRAFDIPVALRRMAASYPGCTVFAVAHGEACFIGATPERLIALHNGLAATMALAGSGARGASPAEDQALADRLLHDPKERSEHAVVVGALRDGLTQVSTRVIADAQPRIHKLANVQHLLTPIRAQVVAGTGVLDLVERLHPTPAVGGFPRQRALDLIRAHEALDRGWYASPIGWVNAAGEGEFVVGLRSALVRGATARLFAGCGIVADSNPGAETAELGWKLRPMRAALDLAA